MNQALAADVPHCFHCGLPASDPPAFSLIIDGQPQAMCCAGCKSVAEAIIGNGLGDYYKRRAALPDSPRDVVPVELRDLQLYDHPKVQSGFVREMGVQEGIPADEQELEAALILEGVTCAACLWLIETQLRRQPGVTGVEVNYATQRARIRWHKNKTHLSSLLAAVAAIGYTAYPYDQDRAETLAQNERKRALWRLFVAGFGMMQVMMYAIPVYLAEVGQDGDMTPDIERLMRWASMILTVPVVLYSAAPFFKSAWRDLKLGRVGMDTPVALGVGAAFLASVWATFANRGEVYFDSVTMFVFFLLSGRYLEMMVRQKATRGVEAMIRATPVTANRFDVWPGDAVSRIAAVDLVPGDMVLVKPGETVPADGVIVQGESAADESLLTGESQPINKRSGDGLTGGCVNIFSPLIMRIERAGESTRLASIQRLMERALSEKPTFVNLADKIAAHFTAILLVLAAGTGALWWVLSPDRALANFVAVLVVSCPCALSLATPAALTVATGAMARRGLLVTRGHAIETLARVTHLVFDKTGTLTHGKPEITGTLIIRGSVEDALSLAAALERGSEHPIAQAFLSKAPELAGRRVVAEGSATTTGVGVSGVVDGVVWRLGRPDFVQALHGKTVPEVMCPHLEAEASWIALGSETGWQAFFSLSDGLRGEASDCVAQLNALNIRTSILSGDAQSAVNHVAHVLGIRDASGGLMPEAKLAHVQRLQQTDADAENVVAMIGDGVNDAPVLAQAAVSIAMGGGTDLARSQGDIVLLGNNLLAIVEGIRLAQRTMRIVKQNLFWAATYNLGAIPLAMAGWISPWVAGIGMSASSLLVVLNALRIQPSKIS